MDWIFARYIRFSNLCKGKRKELEFLDRNQARTGHALNKLRLSAREEMKHIRAGANLCDSHKLHGCHEKRKKNGEEIKK